MVALASPKRRSAPDVQELAIPVVEFYAMMDSEHQVWIQIRKKDKKTFALWIYGEAVPVVDKKISLEALQKASESGEICSNVKIKMTPSSLAKIRRILVAD